MMSGAWGNRVFRSQTGSMLAAVALCLAPPSVSRAMEFSAVTAVAGCSETCVIARGYIDNETAAQFRQYATKQRLRPGASIVLDSLGGSHTQGILLGEAIRKYKFNIIIGRYDPVGNRLGPAVCASACVYALMGGQERRVFPGSKVGVHQVRLTFEALTGQATNQAQLLMALAATHLIQCGATVDVLTLALSTPPDEMRWLSEPEMTQFHVITDRVEGAAPVIVMAQADLTQTIRFRLLGLPVADSGKP